MRDSGKSFVYAGVGSRDLPFDIELSIMELSRHLADLGAILRSGGAPGSDTAFYNGVLSSDDLNHSNIEIYLAWSGMNGHKSKSEMGFFNASRFDNFEAAIALATEARGSLHGLGMGGVALHGRNAYQILGRYLSDPANLAIVYAKPMNQGKTVKGGTNTAYQISKKFKVPILNLYLPNDRERAERLLSTSSIDDLITFAQELKREQYPD